MLRSTILFYSLFFVFILLKPLPAQTHTFGPEKESFSLHASGGDYVGVNCCPAVAYRVINKWAWTYDELPNEAIVTSVRLRFFAAPHLNPPSHFAFNIHNIQEDIDWTSSLGELFDEYPQVIKSGETVTDVNGLEYFEMIANSTENVNFFNAVKNAVNGLNHFICLGFKKPVETGSNGWYDFRPYENYNDQFSPAIDLFVYYELPEYSVQFFNSISGTLNSGSLILNNDIENPIPSGASPIYFELLDPVDIRTAELPFIVNWNGSGTTQKHNYWDLGGANFQYTLHNEYQVNSSTPPIQKSTFLNTTSVTIRNLLEWNAIAGGLVELKDPWLYYETNGSWEQSNNFISYLSPLEIQNNTINSYGGVFLNQGSPNWTPPYYKAKALQTQDIKLYNTGSPVSGRWHKFYFQNWSGSDVQFQNANALETGVVFTDDDAIAQANLKGSNLTKDNDAYYSTSQRTFVKSDDGYLHSVYTSQGKVWYEVSADNGVTWKIQKNGTPIATTAKNPSIDFSSYFDDVSGLTIYLTVIVWQETAYQSSKIKMSLFWRNSLSQTGIMNYEGADEDLGSSTGLYSSTNCTPVVSLSLGNYFYVVYKHGNNESLFYRRGHVSHGNYPPSGIDPWEDFAKSLNTSACAKNPSIVVNKGINPTFQLVWESPGTVNTTDIWYGTFSGNGLSGVTNISSGNGYPLNYSPCISLANGNVIVSWTGYWDGNIWKVTNPDDALYRKKAIVRVKSSSGWSSSFTELGDNVNYVNNNSANTSAEKSVFVWSEGSTAVSKWIKRESGRFGYIHNLSHFGIQHQVSTGSDFNTMTSMVFNANQLPYYFIKSTSDFNIVEEQQGELNKITTEDSIITFGRSGIVNKNGVEFVFNVGDVSVGDSVIRFVSYPDTISITSTSDMNVQSKTEAFYLNPGTPFYFSDMYYVIRQELADTALTEQDVVNFKVELLNAQSEEVIGTFDNITYNKNNPGKFANMNYQVDCSGIQPGDYYLRLVTTANGDGEYSLSDIKRNSLDLEKSNYSVISFFGENLPVTYELSQNYPNPFNPTTKIKYQMPVDGMVTLKVYDILGAEITTLVEEEKTAGRYEVNFDASKLASGVYIYRLTVNDYVNVKKMVLLK